MRAGATGARRQDHRTGFARPGRSSVPSDRAGRHHNRSCCRSAQWRRLRHRATWAKRHTLPPAGDRPDPVSRAASTRSRVACNSNGSSCASYRITTTGCQLENHGSFGFYGSGCRELLTLNAETLRPICPVSCWPPMPGLCWSDRREAGVQEVRPRALATIEAIENGEHLLVPSRDCGRGRAGAGQRRRVACGRSADLEFQYKNMGVPVPSRSGPPDRMPDPGRPAARSGGHEVGHHFQSNGGPWARS